MEKNESTPDAAVQRMPEKQPVKTANDSNAVRHEEPERFPTGENGASSRAPVRLVYADTPRSRLERVAVMVLLGACVAALGILAYLFHRLQLRDGEAAVTLARFERQIQRLDAGITFDSRRQQLLLAMRDEIMRANPRIGLHDAYQYAEYIQAASESYPSVPPLFLLAIGVVESGFRPDAVGEGDARGLYQIRPGNGRILARTLGWDFDESMLFDPETSTRMAALHLDILFASHEDPFVVLAEYRGGPRNAGLLKARSGGEALEEVRGYALDVMGVYDRLSGAPAGDARFGLTPFARDQVLEEMLAGREALVPALTE